MARGEGILATSFDKNLSGFYPLIIIVRKSAYHLNNYYVRMVFFFFDTFSSHLK